MIEMMLRVLESPVAPWLVLGGASAILVVEAYHSSRTALWGDMFTEDMDD